MTNVTSGLWYCHYCLLSKWKLRNWLGKKKQQKKLFVVRELWSSTRGHCCEGRLISTNPHQRRSMSPSPYGKPQPPPPLCASLCVFVQCVCVSVCVYACVCVGKRVGEKKEGECVCVCVWLCTHSCHFAVLSLLSVCWEYVVLSSHRRSKLLNVKVVASGCHAQPEYRSGMWNVVLHNLHVVSWQQGESVAPHKSESVIHATVHLWTSLDLLL